MIDFSTIKWINVHTHYQHRQEGTLAIHDLDLFETEEFPKDDKLYAIGMHPWYLEDLLPGDEKRLGILAAHKRVIAIGEAGLDKACDTPYPLQRKHFIDQIRLADQLKKPMIIHCVKAWPELISIYKAEKPQTTWIVHGFNNSADVILQLTGLGIYLSFGRAVLNPESRAAKEIHTVPDHLLFLETDDSAIEMSSIYEKTAELKGITVEQLAAIIESNFKTCFPGL
jgi:TatD DNase family protein